MAAVIESRTDVPFDTADPLFRFGHGLRYTRHVDHPVAHQVETVDGREAPPSTVSGSTTATGTWVLTIHTPRGDQQGELRLTGPADTLVGSFNDTPVTAARLVGDQLTFRTALTTPVKLKIKCSATIDGDTLSGTAKAAMIPISIPFTGIRSTS
jgi:hypothetical protein